MPTPIYHMTHVRNLASVIADGCLYCDRLMDARGISGTGIAHSHIKERRANRLVAVCQQGTLADYVPFYFAPRSPMLYAAHCGSVEGYDGGQRPIVHLVGWAEEIDEERLPFAFTDGHAVMQYSQFFVKLADLGKIDWEVMRATYWRDTQADPDRKRRRQAEFLVYQFFPWELVRKIGVIDTEILEQVNAILRGSEHRPPVTVNRDWYY